MEKNRRFNIRMIVGTALLVAIEVVLQLISSLLPVAINLNLSLVVITLGAILYGPIVGGFLGFINGVIILLSPNTVTVFMSISPVGTVITCLLKATIAGVLAGFAYKLLKNKNDVFATILASFIVPVFNTLIFAIFTSIFFLDGLGLGNFGQIFTVLIGINFLFEIITNLVISPSLYQILKKNIS